MQYKGSKYIYEEYREPPMGCARGFLLIFTAIIATVLLCFFSGCKSVQPLVEVREVAVHDTTFLHDSTFVDRVQKEFVKGDSIFIKDSVFIFKYKYKDKVVVEEVHDSIPYKVEVRVPVRQRNWYDKGTSVGFWLLFVAFLACAAFKLLKLYFYHK